MKSIPQSKQVTSKKRQVLAVSAHKTVKPHNQMVSRTFAYMNFLAVTVGRRGLLLLSFEEPTLLRHCARDSRYQTQQQAPLSVTTETSNRLKGDSREFHNEPKILNYQMKRQQLAFSRKHRARRKSWAKGLGLESGLTSFDAPTDSDIERNPSINAGYPFEKKFSSRWREMKRAGNGALCADSRCTNSPGFSNWLCVCEVTVVEVWCGFVDHRG